MFELTHGSFGSDGDRLQENLDDAGSDPRRVLVVGVQVVENLLDDVMGVLSLDDGRQGDKETRKGEKEGL